MALLLLAACHASFTLRYTWYEVVGQLPPAPVPPGSHVTVADVPVEATLTFMFVAGLGLMLGAGVGVGVGDVGNVVEAVAVKSRLAEDSEKPLQELP